MVRVITGNQRRTRVHSEISHLVKILKLSGVKFASYSPMSHLSYFSFSVGRLPRSSVEVHFDAREIVIYKKDCYIITV